VPLYNKYPRLPTENYLGRRTYFVTICCAERRPVFTDLPAGHETLSKLFALAAKHGFSLHSYCLMPDHLHVVAEGTTDGSDLLKFVHGFKQQTGYEYQRAHQQQLWQTRFYDHIVRSADDLEDVNCYIWMNPVRKGLCSEPRLYPLSGSQTIEWMKKPLTVSAWVPPWKKPQPG
jgi:REP-associated tyrosine transposase